MSWCSDAPEDEAISLFAGLLDNPDVRLSLRESLDDALRHLLPWDIELVIDESVDEPEEEPEV